MSHITTGFHRVGVVIAIPVLLLSAWFAFSAWRSSQPLPACKGMFDDLVTPGETRPTCYQPAKETGERGPWETYRGRYTYAEVYGSEPDYSRAAWAAVAAIALYFASWAAGWVLRGFSRSG